MIVSYDKESDILYVAIGERYHVQELEYDSSVLVLLVGDDPEFPCNLAGIEISGASHVWPIGDKGYDAENDVLTLGTTADAPELVTENGDIIGHWGEDPYDPKDCVPIGVSLRRASRHLAPLGLANSVSPEERAFVLIYYDDLPKEEYYSTQLGRYVSRHLYHNVFSPGNEEDFGTR